jgi:hypothetical protein
MRRLAFPLLLSALLFVPAGSARGEGEVSAFRLALEAAERALAIGDVAGAEAQLLRALERDKKSVAAWDLAARLARKRENADAELHARHRQYRLALAQRTDKAQLAALRSELEQLDPLARELYGMNAQFLDKLRPIAARYEKEGRPHSAIRVHKKILALEPEDAESLAAVERIAALPDPSLAGDAKPKDLFADVSAEWIREHDRAHAEWDTRAKLERENYTTHTDAGYEVLVRTAEAMEQMNAFYRQFFEHGTEEGGGSVPRIDIKIFKNRDEYLELGSNPPEWSGGIFTGSAVETYIGSGGFNDMVGTLFHEAAHQFVSLATNASGWLNEGLASFFEGTRILPNGTVIMNMPADQRLGPLVERMERGWMTSASDGLDPEDPNKTPDKAPTFRIVLENRYDWGPPWYAPTWGVVYFLYNYQDPADGRFVYREAFEQFIDASGGRVGEGAVEKFEEVVLQNPSKPLVGIELPEGVARARLPQTVAELDPVWKDWLVALRDERTGRLEVERPYLRWGRFAAKNKHWLTAREHFEKGLVAEPDDSELLLEFAELLSKQFEDPDRAAKLVREALHFLERAPVPDLARIRDTERLLAKLDPKQRTLEGVIDEMDATARSLLERYLAAERPMMVMDLAWRLSTSLELSGLLEFYEQALRRTGKSFQVWDLAYNEQDLTGWNTQGTDGAYVASGSFLEARFGSFDEADFAYQILTLDKVTAGDFSMQADVQAEKGQVNFCGFVFGHKGASSFHALVLFPGKTTLSEAAAETGWVDLMSSFGTGSAKTWRHIPVDTRPPETGRSAAGTWHELRLDVAGKLVDIWYDGTLLATHEFPSLEVLRGAFGLICGPGEARFRNVRYLARDPRDPAAQVERAVRTEALKSQPGVPVGGSYQGLVPPWPKVKRWVQEGRTSWAEAGPVLQLLVFFSIQQNDLVRIDAWLEDLARRMQPLGMRFVCIASPNDEAALAEYLKTHPMPGAVGIDNRPTVGIGETFEAFFIRRFNLPRLLLLDIDGTVAWEGDPGFSIGAEWDSSVESFLEAPLQELIAKRKLVELGAWREDWPQARAALAEGRLEAALPTLLAARAFDGQRDRDVGEAQRCLAALAADLAELDATAAELCDEARCAALSVLLDWAPLLERPVTARDLKRLEPLLGSKDARAWTAALKACERYVTRKREDEGERRAALLQRLAELEGPFVRELEEDLSAAADDAAELERLVAAARGRPRRWLAAQRYGW